MKLHTETLALVKEERRITGLVISNLQKIYDTKLYLQMGFSSMFEYCTRGLGYSEASAYRRISTVKLSATIPEIKAKLDSGDLNMTTLSMAQSFFTRAEKGLKQVSGTNVVAFNLESKKKVLAKIENCSKKQTEEILIHTAVELGLAKTLEPARNEKLRVVSSNEVALHLRLKKSTLSKLEQIKSLRAHKNPNMSYADLIEDMSDYMLKKIDLSRATPMKKTKAPARSEVVSRYIPSHIKRAVWQRDQGQCTYRSELNQQRCGSKHLLQIDHIIQFSQGGPNSMTNLRLLCHAHHRLRER